VNRLVYDLCCKAGGTSMGYYEAGFDVVGVDRDPQPNYPFPFIRMDVVDFLQRADPEECAAFVGSPPCQRFSAMTSNKNRMNHPDLITPVRKLLLDIGKPYVLENVPGSPLRNPVKLCGEMFGLRVVRHRWFETNWPLRQPKHLPHQGKTIGAQRRSRGARMILRGDPEAYYFAVYGQTLGDYKGNLREWRDAMGIQWMDHHELAQAVPPAYTRWIGMHLRRHLGDPVLVEPVSWSRSARLRPISRKAYGGPS
jgi:DNA (cytosine-5)-methyltransferase 1